jgi:hypothetical protein
MRGRGMDRAFSPPDHVLFTALALDQARLDKSEIISNSLPYQTPKRPSPTSPKPGY